MDKLFIRLEFKGAATVRDCQEILNLIKQHQMVKTAEFVINGDKLEVMEKKEIDDGLL